jgi:CheY-like chemotaxis protein
MLHQRGGKIQVIVDCPENLVVDSDRLRLKQTILNLGRNSAKFVEEGFIRLRALVVDDHVHLFVEDSGCGIPQEKHGRLFHKYQESLDLLSQGTVRGCIRLCFCQSGSCRRLNIGCISPCLICIVGCFVKGLGLFLCKSLIDLMDGDIHLDETYDSGIAGYPGTRFVINLKRPLLVSFASNTPLVGGTAKNSKSTHSITSNDSKSSVAPSSTAKALPDSLSVLFVDDDPILRKMFKRMILNVAAPNWTIREASSGEAALQLCDAIHFDLIFVDQYMASTEKQLLGTETVEIMRAKGIKCVICGLSANEKESEFLQAGANAFSAKPFPIESVSMTKELCRILSATGPINGSIGGHIRA